MFIYTGKLNYKELDDFIESERKDVFHLKESEVQEAVINYLESKDCNFHPSFSGLKAKSYGQKVFMKKQGMRKGYPDIVIYKMCGGYGALFLELKTVVGTVSKEQKEKMKQLLKNGYACSVSKGYYDAIKKINKYFDGEAILYKE